MKNTKTTLREVNDALNWRYATKAFYSSRILSEEELQLVLESLRLTASSYGLQPWKFIVVKDKTIRQKIKEAAWNQAQVSDASHLLVLTSLDDLSEGYVEDFIEFTAKERGIDPKNLADYRKMILGSLTQSKEKLQEWMAKQVYIALGNLLTTCAVAGIDACPMEGFDRNAVDKILALDKKGLKSVVLCPIGFRSKDDKYSQLKKVRFAKKDVIVEV